MDINISNRSGSTDVARFSPDVVCVGHQVITFLHLVDASKAAHRRIDASSREANVDSNSYLQTGGIV